jgi:hypothetical protein
VTTEEWICNFCPVSFRYYLKFRDDIIVEIRTGAYGY